MQKSMIEARAEALAAIAARAEELAAFMASREEEKKEEDGTRPGKFAIFAIARDKKKAPALVQFDNESLLDGLHLLHSMKASEEVARGIAAIIFEYSLRFDISNFDFDAALADIAIAGGKREAVEAACKYMIERSDAVAEARVDGISSSLLAGAL